MKRILLKQLAITVIIATSVIILDGCNKPDSSGTELPKEQMIDGDFTVVVNPSGLAPLTARLEFSSKSPTILSILVIGKNPISGTTNDFVINHKDAILGLYPNQLNIVIITVIDDMSRFMMDTLYIQTSKIYDGIPDINIETNLFGSNETNLYFSDLHFGNSGKFSSHPIVFDTDGIVRWSLDLSDFGSITMPVKELENGNIFFGHESGVYEYDKLGFMINSWLTPGYRVHHDVVEMPNGNILAAVQKYGTTIVKGGSTIASTDDHIIELSRGSGVVIKEWDVRKYLDVNRIDVGDGGGDWFHMNGLSYSEVDDCIIVSGRNQGVIKINRNDELIWILAAQKGWGNGGRDGSGNPTTPYLLQAVDNSGTPFENSVQQGDASDASFDWGWGQHAPQILSNGNLMLFDNGYNRQFGATAPYSRGVEYKIVESSKTIQQVWTFGESRGNSSFSPIISNSYFYDKSQTVVFAPGFINDGVSRAKVVELTYATQTVLFEANLDFKNLTSNGQPGWGTIDIIYRSGKTSLY